VTAVWGAPIAREDDAQRAVRAGLEVAAAVAVLAQTLRWFAGDPTEPLRIGKALGRLLGLDDGKELIEQGELFSAWRALLERLGDQRPIVVVFEEVQLADQALLDFIGHLREWGAAVGALHEALSLFERALDLTDDEHERAAIFEASGFVGYRAGDIDAATTPLPGCAGTARNCGQDGRAPPRLGQRVARRQLRPPE
jgi:hypothetical protein